MKWIALTSDRLDDRSRSLELAPPRPGYPSSHDPCDERDEARDCEERIPDQGSPMA